MSVLGRSNSCQVLLTRSFRRRRRGARRDSGRCQSPRQLPRSHCPGRAPARARRSTTRCAEAERLAHAAVAHTQRLRDVKAAARRCGSAQREADARVRDRRQLNEAKENARSRLPRGDRPGTQRARSVREAARVWLREIDRLNRQVASADDAPVDVTRRAAELERVTARNRAGRRRRAHRRRSRPRRPASDARRALADCEEGARAAASRDLAQAQRPRRPSAAAHARPRTMRAARGDTSRPSRSLLRGDRNTLLSLALRLAEETGVEAGRLQLLLLELREQIAARALEQSALHFPESHPFWSQFAAERRPSGCRQPGSAWVIRFDGRGGWIDDHVPDTRASWPWRSRTCRDRSAQHPPPARPGRRSTRSSRARRVAVEEFLATTAPDLELGPGHRRASGRAPHG